MESPEQWRWSSYRHYLLGEAGLEQVNLGWARFRSGIGWRERVKKNLLLSAPWYPPFEQREERGTHGLGCVDKIKGRATRLGHKSLLRLAASAPFPSAYSSGVLCL